MPWEAVNACHENGLEVIQQTAAFHHIIGYRYSRARIDPCPISMAYLPGGAQRYINCLVQLYYPAGYGTNTQCEVRLPYENV